ncbi:MAG: hypothetical protein V4436_00545 [Patescibacteria group bacterium]
MKAFIVIVIIGFVAVGAYLLLAPTFAPQTPSPTATTTTTGTQHYSSSVAGIAFDYPNTYKLEERSDSFEGQPITVITLIDKNVVVPDMSEGPPSISIIVVLNASSTPLDAWVKAKSISNFNLSDKKLSSTTVDTEPGVSYTHSGLYESEAVVVAHGGKIYLMSVGSVSPTETIYSDFQKLLSTVELQ